MIWFMIAILLLSVVVLWLGLRGRRIGSQPVCRRCGYDLTGRPQGSNICSECGADLSRRSAVRRGHRQRHWGLALLAVVIGALAAIWLAPRVRALAAMDWEPYKPTFWINYEAESHNPVRMQRAVDEMHRRLSAGELSDDQTRKFVSTLLKVQTRVPPAHLIEILQSARAQHLVSREEWEQFWRQAFPCDLHTKVNPDNTLEVWLYSDPRKQRYADPVDFLVGFSASELRVGTIPCDCHYLNFLGSGTKRQIIPLVDSPSEQLGGLQTVRAAVTMFVGPPYNARTYQARFSFNVETTVILPAGRTPAAPNP